MKGFIDMKKFILFITLFTALIFSQSAFGAVGEITVTVDGETLNTPIPAQIVNGRTMLPMRSIFERLGAVVIWVDSDRLIFATKGNTFITLKIGVPQMSVQTTESTENKVTELDTAPFIENGYTLVPVRAVAESLNANVEWIEDTKTVAVITN